MRNLSAHYTAARGRRNACYSERPERLNPWETLDREACPERSRRGSGDRVTAAATGSASGRRDPPPSLAPDSFAATVGPRSTVVGAQNDGRNRPYPLYWK